ncbi:MAG: T9SS type A sorting domain-containing protein, partial [Leadbetterella sp.]|nr:T9SS type A sorting domain-containing protein [Leadbetterella sp.]
SPVVFKTISKEKFLCYSMDKDCMFVSNDAGINWEKTWTYSGTEIWNIANLEIRDESEIYFSIGHNINKSLDQGCTWQNVQTLDYEIYNLSISPWGNVYASTSNGIFVSSVGKWSKIPLQTNSSNIFYSEAGMMFINSGAGLYQSFDYGKTFKKAELGLTNPLGKADIVGDYLFVKLNYLPGIFKTKLDSLKATFFSEGNLVDNYPNPFNSGTVIEFYLKKDELLELKVYDILGREIETILSKNLSAGFYHYVWQPQNLPSGVYFYRIQTPTFSETKKMIYLK